MNDARAAASTSAPGSQLPSSNGALYSVRVIRDPAAGAGTIDLFDAPCPVCGGPAFDEALLLPDIGLRVIDCRNCGLGRLHPAPAPAEIARWYPKSYYGHEGAKFSWLIEWLVRAVGSRHARFLIRQLPAGARVLDVGCGRGAALRPLLAAGCEVHGFELTADALSGIDPRIHTRVAGSLVEAGFEPASFDMVILWHVLEHVPNPREVLSEIARLLRPRGLLIVAVPNYSSLQARFSGPAWFHLDLPRHLFQFPVGALRRLLTDVGLTCRSEHHFSLRQNPFGWVQSLLNRCAWLPRNGLYVLLHHRSSQDVQAYGRLIRCQLWLAFLLLMGPALVLSVIAAIARSGATVHVVAARPQDSA